MEQGQGTGPDAIGVRTGPLRVGARHIRRTSSTLDLRQAECLPSFPPETLRAARASTPSSERIMTRATTPATAEPVVDRLVVVGVA